MVKLLNLDLIDVNEQNFLSSFGDDFEIATWSKNFVNTVVKKELMKGYNDQSFKPSKNITRAEAILVMNNALNMNIKEQLKIQVNGIAGKVFKDDQPAVKAKVRLFANNTFDLVEEVWTDDTGEFSFEVGAGDYDITVVKEGYVTYASKLKVGNGEWLRVDDLILTKGVEVKGTFLTHPDGNFVKGAEIIFTTNPSRQSLY